MVNEMGFLVVGMSFGGDCKGFLVVGIVIW